MPKTKKIQKRSIAELRMKQLPDLIKLGDEMEEEMVGIRMEIGLGRQKNVRAYKNMRREYAVVQTLIKEKEMEEKVAKVVQVVQVEQNGGSNNHENI